MAPSPAPQLRYTQWTLPLLAGTLCLLTAASMFAHGTAALAWLVAALGTFLGALPTYLIIMRLRGHRHEQDSA